MKMLNNALDIETSSDWSLTFPLISFKNKQKKFFYENFYLVLIEWFRKSEIKDFYYGFEEGFKRN